MSWLPVVIKGLIDLFGGGGGGKEDNKTREELRKAQEDVNRLLAANKQQTINFEALERKYAETQTQLKNFQKIMEEQKIDSLEKLTEVQKKQFDRTVEICKTLPESPAVKLMKAIGFVGPSGVGKSSLINAISGRRGLCKVGRNQTTMSMVPYIVNNVAYFDIPGTNHRFSYLSTEYIGVFKGLKFIGVVVNRSIDDISNICLLLERLSIPFVIICNQCDYKMDQEGGIENFKAKFIREVVAHNFRSINVNRDIYFVSAEQPNTEGTNWEGLIDRIVDKVGAENFWPPVESSASTSA